MSAGSVCRDGVEVGGEYVKDNWHRCAGSVEDE